MDKVPPAALDEAERLSRELLTYQPSPVSATMPANGAQQKARFLAGEITVPDHKYPKLTMDQAASTELERIGEEMTTVPGFDKKYTETYRASMCRYIKQIRLLEAMNAVKTAPSPEARDEARGEFMSLNIELYGVPDRTVYFSLLSRCVTALSTKEFSDTAVPIFTELQSLLPAELDTCDAFDRFEPSPETIAWVRGAVNELYGPMFRHIPEKDCYDVQAIRDVFQAILDQEFGDAAEGWRVAIEPARSIHVEPAEKRIVIPEGRDDLTREQLQAKIVHEIGVHVLRSITGEQSGALPLRLGVEGYYGAEEGLGKVMEQALASNAAEPAGVDHYLTAGAAYFDHKNFRETFEMKWRLALLSKLGENELVTLDHINQAKDTAYGGTMRIFRGTDELPWFKDLAYYNGTTDVWKFLDAIRGDDFRLTLLMMGKIDTSQEHLRLILESRSVR